MPKERPTSDTAGDYIRLFSIHKWPFSSERHSPRPGSQHKMLMSELGTDACDGLDYVSWMAGSSLRLLWTPKAGGTSQIDMSRCRLARHLEIIQLKIDTKTKRTSTIYAVSPIHVAPSFAIHPPIHTTSSFHITSPFGNVHTVRKLPPIDSRTSAASVSHSWLQNSPSS
jgi:hypothetical protein